MLRFGDDSSFIELGVSTRFRFRVFRLRSFSRQGCLGLTNLGAVACQSRFGLPQCALKRTRIDLKQEVAFGDILSLSEVDAEKLTGHLRFDLHDGGRFDVADHAQLKRN